ncbi:DUF3124 domain-containing protein [Plebeiibacterium sediminum]|uniref:DUF3124 domain-containing protein n=1 Tax=Plebeiibacterium sediminum TaxID=2992112 RepID=A0AAE3SG83_9BACT|nr:DUF3124 domain-containing protein [Plebeiobacterium sediminum]MCW3788235.1 DUF3124 domain-containing protein [Plebeiobacterium sediminum]
MMKAVFKILFILLLMTSCQNKTVVEQMPKVNWESKKVINQDLSVMMHGKTYLPVYSHIYHTQEHKTFDLTITVGIRNISVSDTVYITKADYFNTEGHNIRQYIKEPIFIKPMETIEIVIAEEDKEGGSGANFMFDWAVSNPNNHPLFEAVMISTYGQQGLSFTTRGVEVN